MVDFWNPIIATGERNIGTFWAFDFVVGLILAILCDFG